MPQFNTIGILGRQRISGVVNTLYELQKFLESRQLKITIDDDSKAMLAGSKLKSHPRAELGKHCDLIIVVGGDGSMLAAARSAAHYATPVLGINSGRLGFLTDIRPDMLAEKIADVLDGKYREEKRFLLSAQFNGANKLIAQQDALNDVVLLPGAQAQMIAFEIFINDQYVCRQRADGIIVATPTGSTAYALSAGGPILHPQLDAIVLVPMFPHTLSSRPIVVQGDSKIEIVISKNNQTNPHVSCDGQERVAIPAGSSLQISKNAQPLRLIHLSDYSYYGTLRSKLGWESTRAGNYFMSDPQTTRPDL